MTTSAPLSSATNRNASRQRRVWDKRADAWDQAAVDNPGLAKVVAEVIAEADTSGSDAVLDLGSGSGQVTFGLAVTAKSVLAVDISEAMISLLVENARARGIGNVEGRTVAIETLQLEPRCVDVVVSNYVLHHLRDEDKLGVVERAYEWLSPGGRLVIGDMMLGRGGSARDREIIASKIKLFLTKGPQGWWRIAKNAGRFVFRTQERPVSIATWIAMLKGAGFTDVAATPVVNEAAVVRGTKPKVA